MLPITPSGSNFTMLFLASVLMTSSPKKILPLSAKYSFVNVFFPLYIFISCAFYQFAYLFLINNIIFFEDLFCCRIYCLYFCSRPSGSILIAFAHHNLVHTSSYYDYNFVLLLLIVLSSRWKMKYLSAPSLAKEEEGFSLALN